MPSSALAQPLNVTLLSYLGPHNSIRLKMSMNKDRKINSLISKIFARKNKR